ncbi:hypothetical protein [Chitinimonas koreensis]|uniref:hypothetical protein n=1 Tax=Chitinimonas koreensis TaxID=356302 RepID=UPI00165456CB|nr:hypothetical protein [Chitinimonas koreensis]QNM98644.1 hypothetical protein H9L41_10730 [Chitinimonas koreensis]
MVDTADGVDTDQGLAGLARTVRKDNGGAAFTLICHQDLFYTNKPKPIPQAQPAPGAGGSGTPPASGSFDTGSGSSGGNDQPELTVSLPGVYLGLDIDEDPFARGEGAVVGGDFELRIGMSATAAEQSFAFGLVAEGPARLRIDALFKSDVDTDAVSGELTLYPQALTYKNGEPDEDDEPDQPASLEVVVYRKGDARSGKVWIVPALASLRRLGLSAEAHWSGQPRLAEVGLRRSIGEPTPNYTHMENNYLLDNGPYLAEESEGPFASFLTLREMEQLPAPESPIRLEALNAIATLSEYTANPAFLSRARNRLFPAVTASGPLRVRAVHDWVMFRRRRQAVCDASCACTAPAAQAEGFQTWHLRLEDVGELETLRQAIDDNDAETLKRFSFKRVDVLHYLDDALTPIELQKTVLADWKKAKPAAKLVLGRVWEQAPRAGQGWQNHYRLRRLVGLLGGLIEPPSVDVVHALSRAPKPLEDAQFDGGMLLVTAEQAPPTEVETAHRVLLIHNENLFASLDDLKSGSATVWNELENQVDQKSTFALTVHFVDGQLAAADETELKKLADEIRKNFDVNFTDAMIVRGNAIPPEQHVQEEHDTIRAAAGAPAAGGDFALPNALLKDAAVATILPFGAFKP